MSKFYQICEEDLAKVEAKKDALYTGVLMWLYRRAVYNEYTRDINGTPITLYPGQYICTYKKIADDIGTDKAKVRRCVDWMEKEGIITKVRKQRCLLITLEHWVTNNSTQAIDVEDFSTWRTAAQDIGGIKPQECEQAFDYYKNNDWTFGVTGTRITTQKQIKDALKGWTNRSNKSQKKQEEQTPSNTEEDVMLDVDWREARISNLRNRLQQQPDPSKRTELERELGWYQMEVDRIKKANPRAFGFVI